MIAGSIIMWIGIISSSFAPNILWVSITQGILFGFGAGLVFMMLPVIITQYFDKYKGLAFGITYSGSTSSAFVFPRLLLFLRETYNFKSSIRIFGAILMHVTAVSLILKEPEWIRRKRHQDKLASRRPKQIVHTVDQPEPNSVKSPAKNSRPATGSLMHGLTVLQTPMFYVVLASYILFGYTFDVFMATVVDFATDRGSNVSDAVSLIPLFSVTDTLGRLCLPVLADRGYLRRSTLAMINYTLMGLILMILPRVESYTGLVVICLVLGTFIGCGVSTYPALMAEYVDQQRLPISFGLVGTVAGPLFILKPLFIGHFRDKIGSYDGMYRILAGGLLVLGILWSAVVCFERRSQKVWKVEKERRCINQVAGHSFYCQPVFATTQPCDSDVEALSAAPTNTSAST
ncbi:monocarboxylate transporter 10-like [Ixodes scapularis]|uniref:monocarboxylate transporter 10-like n=1 Tax=Ixodes scapularis TaxID=6945 RepID=UPI001C394035|nr:monocarboxylate transporter 10-like [Ixodes scapularis]